MAQHHAQEFMVQHRRASPRAVVSFKQLAELRIDRDTGKRDWPANVFVPSYRAAPFCFALKDVVSNIFEIGQDSTSQRANHQEFWRNYVLGAWRMTMGIYQFDKDVIVPLVESSIPDDTPTTEFLRLPEWCCYVDLPTKINNGGDFMQNLYGFWIMNDCDKHGNMSLIIAPDQEFARLDQVLVLDIKPNLSIKESLRRSYTDRIGMDDMSAHVLTNAMMPVVSAILSVTLWLCSEKPDLSNIKDQPVPVPPMPLVEKTKKGFRFAPPSSPVYYQVAKRIGGEIRQSVESHISQGVGETTRKAHIRRAHWHGYWVNQGGQRTFDVRWLPPIFVNGR